MRERAIMAKQLSPRSFRTAVWKPGCIFVCALLVLGSNIAVAEKGSRSNERGQRSSTTAQHWQKTLFLKHYLKGYPFPEELISHPLEFPARKVKAENLKVVRSRSDGPVTYQLSDVATDTAGFLKPATLSFRTDLPEESEHIFVARYEPDYRAA